MATPADFLVKPDEPVRPALDAFAKLVQSQLLRSTVGPGVRVHRGELGVDVVVTEPTPVFRGAFYASLTSPTRCRFDEGLINNLRPVIDGRFLDGTVAPEGTLESPAGVPELDLSGVKPVANRTYLCAALIPMEQGTIGEVTLLHRAELSADRTDEWPIAEVQWADGRIVKLRQMGYFNLEAEWNETRARWHWRSV